MTIFGSPDDWLDQSPPRYATQCSECRLITFQDDSICLPCKRGEKSC